VVEVMVIPLPKDCVVTITYQKLLMQVPK